MTRESNIAGAHSPKGRQAASEDFMAPAPPIRRVFSAGNPVYGTQLFILSESQTVSGLRVRWCQ